MALHKHPINHDFKVGNNGGLPTQRSAPINNSRPSTKPSKASAKPSMCEGPHGGKKPSR